MSVSMAGALSSESLTRVADDGEGLRDAARKMRLYCEQLSEEAHRAGSTWSQLPTVLSADRLTPTLHPLMEPALQHAMQLNSAAEDFYRVAFYAADDLANLKRMRDRIAADIDAFHASAPARAAQQTASQAASGDALGAAMVSSWRDVPALVADEAELRGRVNSYESNLADTLNNIAARIDAIDAPTALSHSQPGGAQAVGYTRPASSTQWWDSTLQGAKDFGNGVLSWADDEAQQALPYLQDFAAQVGNDFLSIAQAIHDHPDDFGTFVAGIVLVEAGGGEEAIGGLLDATGVGAIAGVPANIAGAATIAAGAGLVGIGASDLIGHAMSDDAQSRFDTDHVMEARSAKFPEAERGEPHPEYSGRNKGGKYRPEGNDVSRAESAEKEEQGLRQYEAFTGRTVIRDKVWAKHESSGTRREYDGLADKGDGSFEGIEIKSGSASYNGQQKDFDSKVSYEHPAHATLKGVRIKITSVVVRNVE